MTDRPPFSTNASASISSETWAKCKPFFTIEGDNSLDEHELLLLPSSRSSLQSTVVGRLRLDVGLPRMRTSLVPHIVMLLIYGPDIDTDGDDSMIGLSLAAANVDCLLQNKMSAARTEKKHKMCYFCIRRRLGPDTGTNERRTSPTRLRTESLVSRTQVDLTASPNLFFLRN